MMKKAIRFYLAGAIGLFILWGCGPEGGEAEKFTGSWWLAKQTFTGITNTYDSGNSPASIVLDTKNSPYEYTMYVASSGGGGGYYIEVSGTVTATWSIDPAAKILTLNYSGGTVTTIEIWSNTTTNTTISNYAGAAPNSYSYSFANSDLQLTLSSTKTNDITVYNKK